MNRNRYTSALLSVLMFCVIAPLLYSQSQEGIVIALIPRQDSIALAPGVSAVAVGMERCWTEWRYENHIRIIGNEGFGYYAVFSAFALDGGQRVYQAVQLTRGIYSDGTECLYIPTTSPVRQIQCTPTGCPDNRCMPQVIDGALVCDPACDPNGHCIKSEFTTESLSEWKEMLEYLKEKTKLVMMFTPGSN